MADTEKLIVELGVKDAGTSKQLSAINKELKGLDREYKSANNTSKYFEKSQEGLKTKLTYLQKTYDLNATKLETYKKKMQETTDAIKKQEEKISKMKLEGQDTSKAEEQLQRMKNTLNDTGRQARITENEMKVFNNAISETNAALQNQSLEQYKQKMQQLGENIQNTGQKIQNFGSGMQTTGSTLMKLSAPMVALSGYATKAAIDFESAFTGVVKTVDATDEQLANLKTSILEMSKTMPESASQIASVAESAGQLGIKTGNIENFTKTMVMLGDATNLSSDEAATSLARLANITGMNQDKFSNLGSSVVALGNNFATTESEITEMSLRLAGAGSQVGMSEADITGLAAALSSVGIEAEAGGSAFSKVMTSMQLATETGGNSLKEFADVAGMSAEEFKTAFQTNASSAIISFINGLSKCEENGTSTIKVLNDMGITEVRLRDTLLRASGASETFSDAIKLSNQAWTENTALTKEAETRYATMESRIEMAKNRLKELGIEIGENLMPYVSELIDDLENIVDWFSNLDKGTQQAIVKFGLLTFATGGLLTTTGKVVNSVGGLVTAIGKITSKVGSSAAAFGELGGALSNVSKFAGPVGVALATVGTAVYTYKKEQDALSKSVVTCKEDLGLLQSTLLELNGVHVKSREELEKSGLVYKQLGNDLGQEFKDKVNESTTAINQFNFELNKINMDGVLTEEETNEFTSKVDNMCNTALETIKSKQTETQNEMAKTFTLDDGVIDESEQQVLEYLNKNYNTNIEEVTKLKDDINAIYKQALEDKRGLNEEEIKDIQEKMAKIKQIELEALANNEQEQMFARNEFNNRIKQVDAEGAQELLIQQKKKLDEQNAQTLASYDTQIETMKIAKQKALDEEDKANADNLQKQIDAKTKERDALLQKQQETWDGYIDIVEKSNPELIGKINDYNGEILSNADLQAQKGLQYMQQHYNGLEQVTHDGWYKIKNEVSGSIEDCYMTVDENTGKITAVYNQATGVVGGYTDDMKKKVQELGEQHEAERLKINTAMGQIANSHLNTKNQIVSADGTIIGSLRDVTTSANGVKTGIVDINGTPMQIKTNADGVVTEMTTVTDKVKAIPEKKDVTINFFQKGLDWIKQKWDSIGNKNVKVDANATGTYSSSGGLSTVDENGWELASNNNVQVLGTYASNTLTSIPSGTKISTHMQSVQEMKYAISEEVKKAMLNYSKDNNSKGSDIDYEKLANVMLNVFTQSLGNINISNLVTVDANGIAKNTINILNRQDKNSRISKGVE